MNSLDRPMEFMAAAVFLLVGAGKIFSYRHKPRSLGAAGARVLPEFPYWCVVAVGLFEMAAALALISPSLSLSACAALAGTTGAACIFRHGRGESPAPTIALLLLVAFVVCSRCL